MYATENHTDRLLAELARGLQNGRSLYNDDLQSSGSGREGVGYSLLSVIGFLEKVPGYVDPEFLLPLRELQRSLLDAERGSASPLLKVTKVDHCPPQPVGWMGLKAVAAAAMEGFMRARLFRKEAAAQVAKHLKMLGFSAPRGKPITGRMVEDWRDHCRVGNARDDYATGRYERLVSSFNNAKPDDFVKKARSILDGLPKIYGRTIPKKPLS